MVERFLLPRVFGVRNSVRKRLHKPLVESSDTCFDAKAPLSVVEVRMTRREMCKTWRARPSVKWAGVASFGNHGGKMQPSAQ